MNAFSKGVLLATQFQDMSNSVLLELSSKTPEIQKGVIAVQSAREVNFSDTGMLLQIWQNLDVKIKVLIVNHWREQRTVTLTSAIIHWLTI